jgi:hypothetical protein
MADCTSHGKKWVKRVAVLVVVLLIFGACAGCIHQEEGPEPAPALEDYFRGDFTVTGEPILDQEVEVIFSVKPITESLKTKIWIILPEGIKLTQGDLSWEGDLKEDEVAQIKITVRPIREGQWEIWSYVEGLLDGQADKSLTYYLYLLTSADSGHVSRTPFYSEYSVEGTAIEGVVNMVVDSPPNSKVNEEIVLTFSLISSKDLSNVKAVIVFPEEFTVVNGTLEWTGDLEAAKEIAVVQVTIIPTEMGRFWFVGIVTWDSEEEHYGFQIYVS